MVKVVFFWRDSPVLSPDECESRYRAVHMPLARRAFDGVPGFISLTYNRVRGHTVNDYNQRQPRQAEPEFHAWVELRFADRTSFDAAMARPALADLFADHPNFMDVDRPANIHV